MSSPLSRPDNPTRVTRGNNNRAGGKKSIGLGNERLFSRPANWIRLLDFRRLSNLARVFISFIGVSFIARRSRRMRADGNRHESDGNYGSDVDQPFAKKRRKYSSRVERLRRGENIARIDFPLPVLVRSENSWPISKDWNEGGKGFVFRRT